MKTRKEYYEYFEYDESYWFDNPNGEMTKEDWKEIEDEYAYNIFNSDYYKQWSCCGFGFIPHEAFEEYVSHIENKKLIPLEEFLDDYFLPKFSEDCKGESEFRYMVEHESHYW